MRYVLGWVLIAVSVVALIAAMGSETVFRFLLLLAASLLLAGMITAGLYLVAT